MQKVTEEDFFLKIQIGSYLLRTHTIMNNSLLGKFVIMTGT